MSTRSDLYLFPASGVSVMECPKFNTLWSVRVKKKKVAIFGSFVCLINLQWMNGCKKIVRGKSKKILNATFHYAFKQTNYHKL